MLRQDPPLSVIDQGSWGSVLVKRETKSLDLLVCEVGSVLPFLRDLLDRGLFHATIKV